MIRRFLIWYKSILKQNAIFVIVLSIVFLISGAGGFFIGVKEGINLVKYISGKVFVDKYETEYDKILKLNTGIEIKYIDELLGEPAARNLLNEGSSYTESFYVCNGYYAYVTSDKNNIVNMYSITISDKDFNAPVPVNGIKNLGKLKMCDLECDQSFEVVAEHEGDFATYSEFYKFGELGKYKYYAFGFSPLGVCLNNNDLIYKICVCGNDAIYNCTELEENKTFMEARKDFKPNSYSVIDESVYLSGQLSENHDIGYNYLKAKDLFVDDKMFQYCSE